MTDACKLTETDGQIALVIPDEIVAKWNVGVGDMVYLTETPDGFDLSPTQPA